MTDTTVRTRQYEETLDPATPEEWEHFRALAHRMLDDSLDYQRDLRDSPAWRPMPPHAKSALAESLPTEGIGEAAVYDDFLRVVLPYNYGNVHPRGWGWVNGQGTPLAVLADMWAATMNPNCWGGEHSASYVEAQVLAWLREALGFPMESSGLLVSGGSMANLIGLAAAREAKIGGSIAEDGLFGVGARPVLYASVEAHNSIDKAASVLGLGTRSLRSIPVDANFRMDLAGLTARLNEDIAAGLKPFCVVATAGTVNTGAIDPLNDLADLCQQYGLWLHVDGAFGALARLAPGARDLLTGVERADSIGFDLHKWMYLPIEVGCVLVRDSEAHRRPFSPPADYLQQYERGPAAGVHFYNSYGPQLTRSFRALKVWMCMRAYGLARYGRIIQQNLQQAQYLAGLIDANPHLELVAPVPLNVVCFRYRGERAEVGGELNEFNRELLMRIWESGVAIPSGTVVNGRTAMRCAFTNHRTRRADLDMLVSTIETLATQLERGN